MKTKRIARITGICAAAAVAAASLVFAAGASSAKKVTLAKLDVGHGTPVPAAALSPADRAMLGRIGATDSSVELLGIRGPVAFYRMAGTDGSLCLGFGDAALASNAAAASIGSAGCLGGPSLATPIIDMSKVAVDPATGHVVKFDGLQGIAADGVASVELVMTSGASATARVTSNLYWLAAAALPAGTPATLIALDANGNALETIPLGN